MISVLQLSEEAMGMADLNNQSVQSRGRGSIWNIGVPVLQGGKIMHRGGFTIRIMKLIFKAPFKALGGGFTMSSHGFCKRKVFLYSFPRSYLSFNFHET